MLKIFPFTIQNESKSTSILAMNQNNRYKLPSTFKKNLPQQGGNRNAQGGYNQH